MKSRLLLAAAFFTILVMDGKHPSVSLGQQRSDDEFYVVSITQFNADTYDVKLKNPRTGYVHSVTVYVDIIININLQIGDRVREQREGGRVILMRSNNGPLVPDPQPTPNPSTQPGITFKGSPDFKREGFQCLALIRSFDAEGAALLDQVSSIFITVTQEFGEDSETAIGERNGPQQIDWSLTDGTYDCDGTPRNHCATLLHELQHALEYYKGTASLQPLPLARDEWASVRMENWLLSRLGLCQRQCYNQFSTYVQLPQDAAVWWTVKLGMQEVRKMVNGKLSCTVVPIQGGQGQTSCPPGTIAQQLGDFTWCRHPKDWIKQ